MGVCRPFRGPTHQTHVANIASASPLAVALAHHQCCRPHAFTSADPRALRARYQSQVEQHSGSLFGADVGGRARPWRRRFAGGPALGIAWSQQACGVASCIAARFLGPPLQSLSYYLVGCTWPSLALPLKARACASMIGSIEDSRHFGRASAKTTSARSQPMLKLVMHEMCGIAGAQYLTGVFLRFQLEVLGSVDCQSVVRVKRGGGEGRSVSR